MSTPSSREEDLSSLVASYLLTVDVSLANSFKQLTGVKPREEHAPSLEDIYNHYIQCPTTLGVQRKRPALADAAGYSNHSGQNNNGGPKNKMSTSITAEVIDLTSWSDPDSQELQTPIKIRKTMKITPFEINNEINKNLQTLASQVPIKNILAPANIPQETHHPIRTPPNILQETNNNIHSTANKPQETNNNIRAPANKPQETNNNICSPADKPQETNNKIRAPAKNPQEINKNIRALANKPKETYNNIHAPVNIPQETNNNIRATVNIPQETNNNIRLLQKLPKSTTVKLEQYTSNDVESPVKIAQGIGCPCCNPRPGPSNWRSGEEQLQQPAANTPVQQKTASPINLLTPEENPIEQHVFQRVRVRPQMTLANPSLIHPNPSGNHQAEVKILQGFKNRLKKLELIYRNGLDLKGNVLRDELRQLLKVLIEWIEKCNQSIKQLNDPTQMELLEQIYQNQLKPLKELLTLCDIQPLSPNRICKIAMDSVNILQAQIPAVRNPQPNGHITYLSKPQQANNMQNLAIPKQTNDVQNLLRPEQKYNLRQTLLRQQIVYNMQIKTETNAEKLQTSAATLHSVIKLLNPDEINQIAAAQKKLQIHPQDTAKPPTSQIREILPQTHLIQQVAVPIPKEVVPNPVKTDAEEAPVIETAASKDQDYQKLLELEQRPLFPNLDAFTCSICLCDCEVGEGVMLHECLHSFCRECLGNLIRHCDDAQVVCPYREDDSLCGALLQEREMRALVSAEDYEKRLAKTVRLAENQMQDAFHCRTADCGGWCVHDANVTIFTCPLCGQTNCLVCKAVHTNETCAQYKQRIDLEEAFQGSDGAKTKSSIEKMIKKGDAMHCPQCRVVVIKEKYTCDWVQCSMCKCEMCWATRGPRWGPKGHGDTSGGCRCHVGGHKCHPKCKNCH